MEKNNKQTEKQNIAKGSVGQNIIAIVLGMCLVVLAVSDVFLLIQLNRSAKVEAYSKAKTEEQVETEVQEVTEQEETDEHVSTMEGFHVGNASSATTDGQAQAEPEVTEEGNGVSNEDYILPESDTRYYTNEELDLLTQEEVKLARNEIYARHGRIFTKDMAVKEYFESKDWYEGTAEEVLDTELNEFEIGNRDLIVAYETEKNWN